MRKHLLDRSVYASERYIGRRSMSGGGGIQEDVKEFHFQVNNPFLVLNLGSNVSDTVRKFRR